MAEFYPQSLKETWLENVQAASKKQEKTKEERVFQIHIIDSEHQQEGEIIEVETVSDIISVWLNNG